jgi:XTP/dITP diphosphohydrolase
MIKLLLATNNLGKLEELDSLLADLKDIQLIVPADIDINLDVVEDGSTYEQNAILKARAFSSHSGIPALADDSGLELTALNGAPGLISARYAPNIDAVSSDRRAYLLSNLEVFPRPWHAKFLSTLCLAFPDGRTHISNGICEGEIIPEERGKNGFGYDSIFLLKEYGKTMAELSMLEKNKLSHRSKSVAEMKEYLSADFLKSNVNE